MPFVAPVPSLDPQSSYGLVRCVKWFSGSRQSLFWCGCDRRRTRFGGLPIGNFASIDITSIRASVGRGSGEGVLESGSNAEAHKPAPDTRDDELQDILKIVALLPAEFRPKLELHEELLNLLEVVMDLGRIPFARFPSGDFALSEDVVTFEDIGYAVSQVGDFGADNRAGIEQTLHRISCLRNRDGKIIGLTCRVGRNIADSADMMADLIFSGASVLLLGRPGVGKTTVIRGVSRLLADECKKRVVIVDTSNEIGGDGDVPHPGIGLARRMQVPHPSKQHQVMIEAIENHMPEVIVIDEVGTELECLAAQTISQRGVQLVATAHGNELENILKNPSLANLIGGISVVTLSDEEARRRRGQKSVLERAGPPAFDVAIEMLNRNEWRVHEDLSEAVDTILAGGTAHGEIRRRDHSGKVIAQPGHLYHARQLPPQLPLEPEVTNLASTASVLSSSAESDIPLSGSISPEAASSTVPQSQEQRAPGSGILRHHTRRDEHDWLDTGEQAVQKSVVLRLYLWGVDPDELWEVMGVLQLQGRVAITSYLQQANAVLGTKSKLKQGGWIRQAAQALGIPMYCLKSSAPAQLARALQTFLTFRPAEEMDSVRDTRNIPAQYDCDFDAADYLPDNEMCQGDEKEAMEEARLAIEEIVIPRGQPIELLPRVPGIIKMQEKLAEFYNLRSRTIGSGNETRLRVLPSNMTDTGDAEGKQLAGVTAKANRSRDHGASCQASS